MTKVRLVVMDGRGCLRGKEEEANTEQEEEDER